MTTSRQSFASINLLHITDFHLLADPSRTMLGINTDESFQMVLEQIREFPFKPDLFLLTGDLVQDAEASTYERLRTQLDQLPAPVYCLPGNHDDPELMQSVLEDQRQIFIQPHISLLGWDIVCLNSTIPNNPCGSLPKS